MSWLAQVEIELSQVLGRRFQIKNQQRSGGGCISESCILESTAGDRIFLKSNQAHLAPMFAAESAGLKEIVSSQSLRAPKPLVSGTSGDRAWLALEAIHLKGQGSWESFGEQLAWLHRPTQPYFGWKMDNTIGSTPQPNPKCQNWLDFFRSHRLQYQFELAAQKGYHPAGATTLLDHLDVFFKNHHPTPSLLHGDLWSGNAGFDEQGHPVIYDPAVYYGDRETDLAMTELFGAFPQAFYASYHNAYPLDDGYPIRKTLYNLYHVLNHFNLFGGASASQADGMIDSLLVCANNDPNL